MKNKIYTIILLLAVSAIASAQNTFDIKFPDNGSYYDKCGECLQAMQSKPSEVRIGAYVDDQNNITLYCTNETWFWNFIKKGNDGVALDVVLKTDFDCSVETKKNNSYPKGTLFRPLYKKDLKKNVAYTPENGVVINMGALPQEFNGEEYELNLIFLKNKYLCYYYFVFNIEQYKWDLLDMGLYTDTITYKTKLKSSDAKLDRVRTYNKRIKFTVPFEKDKTNYSPEDIKPLYDSLKMSNYIVQRMNIRAYASIEGSKAYNMKLQEGRAESIVAALQTFQTESIQQNIQTSENWMEFFEAIKGTEFASLSKKTKQEIKELLKDKAYAEKMEPILSQQRKAIVEIDFEKRYNLNDANAEELKSEFEKAIEKQDITTASNIQKFSFSKIINGKIPSSFIAELEIPRSKEFGGLANCNVVYQYFLDEADLMDTYNEVKRLKTLMPKNKEVAYNYTALRFYLWLRGIEQIDHTKFKREIMALKTVGIPSVLVNRMLVNYHIILTEMYMYQQDYAKKDRNLKSIFHKYKSTDPSTSDLLSLAQYFVAYAKLEWAEKLLKPYISKVDVDEDLLFYYLNLTIVDQKTTKKPSYKQILLNAIDVNNERFCRMFNANNNGGVTFQLLENPFLKSNYCQSCNEE